MKVIVLTLLGWIVYDSDEEIVASTAERTDYNENNNYSFNNWSSELNFKELESFSSSTGVLHNLEVGSNEIDFFSIFIDNDFYILVSKETNKYAAKIQKTK
ncbi:hypothetical protein L9F63_018232, partial [Diploptera punctata]